MAGALGAERSLGPCHGRGSRRQFIEDNLVAHVRDEDGRLVAIEIEEIARLHGAGQVDRVFRPWRRGVRRMLHPGDCFAEVCARDDVDFSVSIDVERRIGEILVVLRIRSRGNISYLVLRPRGSGIPGVSTKHVWLAVAIHIGDAHRLEWRSVVDGVLLPLGCFIRTKERCCGVND